MPQTQQPKEVFLTIGFANPDSHSELQILQIIGLPGKRNRQGKCTIHPTTEGFFDDLIAKPIFRSSSNLYNCDVSALKIWLYDTSIEDQGYQIPEVNQQDFTLKSNVPMSKLKYIFVLDNELQGKEYKLWKRAVTDLFSPLFKEFIAPPESPSFNPFSQLFDSLEDRLDPYAKMKRDLFFDALIIQVD